jgi:hypothetical protein
LAENNRRFHRMLWDGVKVGVVGPEGSGRAILPGFLILRTRRITTGWQ